MGLTDFEIADIIPDSVSLTFSKLGDFLNDIIIVGLNIYDFFLVILFFGLVIGFFYGVFWLFNLYKENKNKFEQIINIK